MLENPFIRLPVEIYGEILSIAVGRIELRLPQARHEDDYTISFSESDFLPPVRSLRHNPWVFALVSKDWCAAIISTPCIWSNISPEILPENPIGHKDNALLSALKLCLDRSRSRSLTIEFITHDGVPSDQVLIFLKLLMEHAQRWEMVTIGAIPDEVLPSLSDRPIQYTRLRRLFIDGHWAEPERAYDGLFRDAPLLSGISLNYCGQRFGGTGNSWSRITHFKIKVDSGILDDLIDILKYTPNLIALEYYIIRNYLGQEVLPIVQLPHLQRLVWKSSYRTRGDVDDAYTSRFFELLKAPQLSVLSLRGRCGDQEVEAIRGCLQRSGRSIAYLDLPTPLVFLLFSLIPDVRTLEFREPENLNNASFGTGPRYGFELAHLQKIVYNYGFGEVAHFAISQFFRLLKASELSVLEVNHNISRSGLKAIRDCLRRSGCSIKSLRFPSARCILLLRNWVPDLETLAFPRSPDLDYEHSVLVLKKLTFDHSADSWLFPKLKKIEFCNSLPAPVFEAFIDMVKFRLGAPTNSLVGLQCEKLNELQVSYLSFSKDTVHRIQERLVPHESLLITCAEPFRYPAWDFDE